MSSNPDNPGQARRKAGRPRGLSEAQVLEAAIRVIREEGVGSFSMRRIARELNTSQGNLYTYYPNKQSLLEALGEYAFSRIKLERKAGLVWDEQLTAWAEALHHELLDNQDIIYLMGMAGLSSTSLQLIDAMSALLQEAGMDLQSSVLHAQSLLWTVMSFSLFESHAGQPDVFRQLQAGIGDQASPSLGYLAIEHLTPLWRANLKRNIDGLRYQVNHGKQVQE